MLCGGLVTLAYLDLGSVMVPWCFLSVQLLQGTWQYRFASSLCSGAALAQRWVPASFHSPCRGLLQHESKNGKKLVSSPLRKVSCPNGTILNFVVCFWAVLRSQESLKKKKVASGDHWVSKATGELKFLLEMAFSLGSGVAPFRRVRFGNSLNSN